MKIVIASTAAALLLALGATGAPLAATPAPRAAAAQAPELAPTFSRHVAPILYAKCILCHRDGEAGPMPLTTFREVRPWASAIRTQLIAGAMPPFHTAPKYGLFPDGPRLTPAESATIVRWVDAGAPEGDPSELPPRPSLPSRR